MFVNMALKETIANYINLLQQNHTLSFNVFFIRMKQFVAISFTINYETLNAKNIVWNKAQAIVELSKNSNYKPFI